MIHSDIIKIAVRRGWQVSITACDDNAFYFDFYRKTRNGLPFTFTATMAGCRVSTLVDEIISFVDALDPGRYACEWMENKGNVSPGRYLKAVDDMDEIHLYAWILAIDISMVADKEDTLLYLPWFSLN